MTVPPHLRLVSSMATRRMLADLVSRYETISATRVLLESVGGVDVARRVKAGEAFDAVILAATAIDELIAAGHIVEESRVDLARSSVAVAVGAAAPHPDISSPEAVRDAVLASRGVAVSTGPSGTHLIKLFAGWGIGDSIQRRIVIAPPGVPVGSLVARGDAELGFQQLSELIDEEGIEVVGALPAPIQLVTTFSGGIPRTSALPDEARAVLDFMTMPMAAPVKQRYGMEPA